MIHSNILKEISKKIGSYDTLLPKELAEISCTLTP